MLADIRLWTSAVGTTIEAEYVATINGQLWLMGAEGRLIKVVPEQLAEAERGLPAKEVERGQAPVANQLPADVVSTLEILARTEIPTYHVNRMPLQAALDRLSDDIARAAPGLARVSFDVGPLGERIEVSLLLRKRSALGVLAFILRAHGLELIGRSSDGRMEIGRRVVSSLPIDSGESPRSSQAPPTSVGRGPAVPALTPLAQQAAPVCTSAANQENFLKQPGFEQATSSWVLENRKSSFRRINSSELDGWNYRPPLESKVMMLKPTPYDGNRHDGPPYLTQEIQFPSGTRRIRVCCDLAYAGDITDEINVRLSITNPNVRYVLGGNTFPFTRVSPLKPKQWRHVEWEADVSEMGSRRLVVGYMFPFSGAAWYIDNTKVVVVSEE